METLAKRKVGGIVAENFRTAKVFTQYGIDFCCKGGISLEEACKKNGVESESLLKDLQEALQSKEGSDYTMLGLSNLIDHIITTHHHYVENTIPALKIYLEKLEKVHGDRHPELSKIRKEFLEAADALTIHMKKEELVLFPYIKAMEESIHKGFSLSKPHFGHIDHPIQMMEIDHEMEGERFRRLSLLSNGYTAPSDGCQTYRVAYALLEEFEQDLHTHIHLENNILFPKAKELYYRINP
jgi:regulator of cell morphogenesis and NO signaling